MSKKKPEKKKQQIKINPTPSKLTPAKKRIYFLIMLMIPIVVILLLETGLRIFNYGGEEKLFISIPDEQSKFYGINLNIAKRYFSTVEKPPTPRKDLFLKVKPANGYRIFVLGESSAAGFPYGNNITFTRILNRMLTDAFPDKYIEVVNTGMAAINSYTQLDFMDEILEQKPDAILIYSGHNEFYGALGVGSMESFGKSRWMVRTILVLQKYRVYQLVRSLANSVVGIFVSGKEDKSDPTATLMERIAKDKIIPLNSEQYEDGKNQFKENLAEIIERAKNSGVKVILSELVSNIHDNEPFESIKTDELPAAREVFSNAIILEKQGKFDEARKAFYYAKDLDGLRFRAPEDFNKIIHELGSVNNAPVVEMKSFFERKSPNGIIGKNLMLEHLHPNIDGYFLMAEAFFKKLLDGNFVSKNWNEKNIKNISYYRSNWGYTKLDSMYAAIALIQLKGGWPFKKTPGPNMALQYYKPKNKIDSIAYRIHATGELTLEQGHMELANYYEQQGDLQSAFYECQALIYTVPFLDLFYESAIKLLVQIRDYDKGISLLSDLLRYQQSAFAYQWIGQFYLIKNETQKGIPFLEKAKELDSQNQALLYNLSRAYYKIFQFEKGDLIYSQLKTIPADPSFIYNLEQFRKMTFAEKQNKNKSQLN